MIEIDEIISRLSPIDVVSEYINLKKSGKNYIGLCPFHPDKNPSFSFDPERGLFHCFGCGKSGNLIQFIMEIEGITFIDALKKLSQKAGIEFIPKKVSERKAKVLEVIKWAKDFYHNLLLTSEGEGVRNYLKERNLNIGTIRNFEIGIATGEPDRVLKEARKRGIDPSLLMEAGLIGAGEGNLLKDFFRERIIFPIYNISGTCVGFGARTFPWKNEEPKYLNSKETPYFNKSKILYGLWLTKDNIKKENRAIIVEGYMDLIKLYQEGIRCVVAPLGTSLTEGHCQILSRYTKNIFLLFDNDESGKAAMERGVAVSLKYSLKPKIVQIEEVKDPDEFIDKYGKEVLKEKIESSKEFFEFYLKPSEDPSFVRKNIEKILEFVSQIPDEVEKEVYVSKLSSFYTIPLSAIKSRMETLKTLKVKREKKVLPEIVTFLHLLKAGEKFKEIINEFEPEDFDSPILKKLVDKIKKGFGFNDTLNELEENERGMLISTWMKIQQHPRGGWEDAYKKLKKNIEEKRSKSLQDLLEKYEREGDKEKVNEVLKKIKELKNFKN
jgi:DNA primase